jgi:ribonuclease D
MFLSHRFNIDDFATQYIDNQADMLAIIPILSSSTAIAIDLEFDRNRYRYGFNMCLIQIEAQQQIFLIDPVTIGVTNMQALWDILENPAILKIMHSPNEDITLLKICGCYPKNIGDTEMAARILSQKQVSLGTLLTENLGIVLDKGQQTSNWNTRPLSMQQLVYAAYDVLHLAKLYYNLQEKVAELGRTDWHAELNLGLEQLEYIPDPEPHRNLPDSSRLSPFDLNITKALYHWRENLAKKWNMPPSNVIGNKQLVVWALNPNFTYADWCATKGMIGRLRNEKDFQYLKHLIQKATAEANTDNLSKTWERPKRGNFTRTREDAEVLKTKLHELRAHLRETHGETVGALMLSTTQCEGVISGGDFTILRKFAQPYIREGATAIGLDMVYFKL